MSRRRRSKKISRRSPQKENISSDKTRYHGIYIWGLATSAFVLAALCVGTLALHYSNSLFHESDGERAGMQSDVSRKVRYAAPQDSAGFPNETPAGELRACVTDVCLWEGRNLYEKLNESVDPCVDFYSYVCTANWYRSNQRVDTRPYRIHTVAQIMYDLQNTFRTYYRQRAAAYHANPSLYTHQVLFFLDNCTSPQKNDSLWVTMKGIYVENLLEGWPYKKEPSNIKLSDVAMVLDKYIGLNSFVRVSLQKTFDDKEYEVLLETPELPLKRHQLVFLDESVADYAKRIERLLSMFTDHDMRKASEDMVQLEQRLLKTMMPRRFLPFDNRTISIKELQRRNTWIWLTYLNYLVEDSGTQFHRETRVIVLDQEYVSKLSLTLSKFSLKTLLNYVGYTLMIKFSPLLPSDVDFLLPLSHDNYLETVPERLQACAHMLEDLCKYLVRRFARLTFGKENSTALYWHYDEEMNRLLHLVRETMKQTVQQAPWLNQAEVDMAAQKIQDLHIEFLGARESDENINMYYPQFVSPFPRDDPLLGYYKLLNETRSFYWISNSTYDLDARYGASTFAVDVEYFTERNMLYLPQSIIGFINNISQTFDPLFVPFFVPHILRGMFSAVDRRGASVSPQKHLTSWWSELSYSEYAKRISCFQELYTSEIQRVYSADYNDNAFLDDNVADNAVIHPLYDIFHKAMHLTKPLPSNARIPGLETLSADKLFFINYAVGHCERAHPNLAARQIEYKHSTPAQLRVNVPLKNYPKFADVFHCPAGSPMNPKMRCELW